jgi:hypothetical protein
LTVVVFSAGVEAAQEPKPTGDGPAAAEKPVVEAKEMLAARFQQVMEKI